MTTPIRSRDNPLIRRVRELLADPAARAREGAYVIEGLRIASEAIESGAAIERALVEASRLDDEAFAPLRQALAARSIPVTAVAGAALRAAQDADAPSGVALLAAIRRRRLEELLAGTDPLLAVAWTIQDPGNLGAIVRSAEAAGAAGLVAVAGGADPYHPRAVRASAGSILRLPVVTGWESEPLLEALRGARMNLVAAVAAGGAPYDAADLSGRTALLLGNEGAGLPADVVGRARPVTVPMRGRVESLNVGVSAALLLFEAARQRRSG